MKVFLLHPDQDFEPRPDLRDEIYDALVSGRSHALASARRDRQREQASRRAARASNLELLEQDLELSTLWAAMAARDEYFLEVARRVVLTGLTDPDEIVYRQEILTDCLDHTGTAVELYRLALEALEAERTAGGLWWEASAGLVLSRSVQLLKLQSGILRRLRELSDECAQEFRSEGFRRFFAMVGEELTDDYLQTVERRLEELELRRGVLESAELGTGDKGRRYAIHPPPGDRGWREWLPIVGSGRPEQHSFEVHPRDEAGARALEEIRTRGLNHIANAVGQSADHVAAFFARLRLELAFYLGAVNLHSRLGEKGEPICFPQPVQANRLALAARGLYDVSLTLHLTERAVGNDLEADGKPLVVITGANQGGKSTLLRGLGLAQLMMQSGMFVGAESFHASVCAGSFTHYKREEDVSMEGGKLDEELRRMSGIVEEVAPHSLLLCNESFASTNEREGSEIARQVIRAMLEQRIRVVFVTHMYDLAHWLYERRRDVALFLRAEPGADGRRPFKLYPGEPLPTSYGADSYRRVFGEIPAPASSSQS